MSDEQRPSGDAARFDEVQSLRAEVEALRSRVTGSAQRAEQDQKIRQLQSAQATLSTQNERLVRTLKDAREQIVSLKGEVGALATALAGKILGAKLEDNDVQSSMIDSMIDDLDAKK